MDSIIQQIATELNKRPDHVENVVRLLDEGNTIPFIARYRKELHGAMDDTSLRTLEERLHYLRGLAERKEAVKKSCQRTFQALRIDVNSEFEVLYAFLEKLPHVLKPGGRAAILTFHSGEDRLVKQAFRQQYRDGLYSDIAQEVTRPSPQECRRNPRAHSTKLRWAVRAE